MTELVFDDNIMDDFINYNSVGININANKNMNKVKSYKTTFITDYYKPKKVYGYNLKTQEWHCLLCGVSMGKNNPRQLCRKSYCENS